MAFDSLRTFGSKLKDKWDHFSLTGRESVKAQAFGAVAVPVFYGGAMILAGFSAVPILLASLAMIPVGFGLTAFATELAKDWFQSEKKETWTNGAGQVVSGTYSQKKDLDIAQNNIDFIVRNRAELTPKDRLSIRSIMDRFNPVAEKVTIVQDIPGSEGRFRFAQKTEEMVVVKKTLAL